MKRNWKIVGLGSRSSAGDRALRLRPTSRAVHRCFAVRDDDALSNLPAPRPVPCKPDPCRSVLLRLRIAEPSALHGQG